MQKWKCQLNGRECGIKEKLYLNGGRIIPYNLELYQSFFADINHQYIYQYIIRQTKKQTEMTLSPCCILVLQTLFKLLSQCSLVPYLESDFGKDGNELDNCGFTNV